MKKGFTLIELLAVIVILAIVAAVTMTVVVPMISGKDEEGAITSVSNMRQQIVNACSGLGVSGIDGVEDMYGKFSGTSVDPTTLEPNSGTVNDCLSGTCTIKFTSAQIGAMNISGELPSSATISFNKCQITSGEFTFTGGTFDGMTIEITTDGKVQKKA